MFSELFDLDFSVFDIKPGSRKENKILSQLRLRSNYVILMELIMGIFTYENLPWRKEFLEELFLKWGWAAMGKDERGIHVGRISYDDRDENGIPIGTATLVTRNAIEMTGEIGKDIIIGFNNDIRCPELLIDQYADMFNETDKSIKSILKKARVNPIPLARDSKIEKAINDLMGSIQDGYTKAIAYDGIKEELFEGADPVTMIHLTEPEHTDKLQYMSKFYDDLLRRFMTFYGHPLSSASKMAQVTTAELEGYSTYSRIYCNIMYENRKDFINRVNEAFGTNYAVDFSKAWEHLKNDIILNNEEVTVDDDSSETISKNESDDSGADSDNN